VKIKQGREPYVLCLFLLAKDLISEKADEVGIVEEDRGAILSVTGEESEGVFTVAASTRLGGIGKAITVVAFIAAEDEKSVGCVKFHNRRTVGVTAYRANAYAGGKLG
jgi:hypothetical protein